MAKDLSSPADLKPAAEGTELQSLLGNIAERAQGGTDFLYTKFFAIGLFRLLELTGVFCCLLEYLLFLWPLPDLWKEARCTFRHIQRGPSCAAGMRCMPCEQVGRILRLWRAWCQP